MKRALAWSLKRSPALLPIPDASKVKYLEENVAAAKSNLSDIEFAAFPGCCAMRRVSGVVRC